MKKIILFSVLALLSNLLLPQPQDQPQATPGEQASAPAPEMDLKKIHFPMAFVEAGKDFPAGDYWLVLSNKTGQPVFTVRNAQQEVLFEELAIVKIKAGGPQHRAFLVKKDFSGGREYFRVKVSVPGQVLLGYFLVKK
jgi:hypothetical protein